MTRVVRLRMVCSLMAALCVLAGAARLGGAAVPLFDPLAMSNKLLCRGARCELLSDPISLLGPVKGIAAERTPGAAEKLAARARAPQVRGLLFASKLVRAVPDAFMFFALALALRRFAGGDPFGVRAIRWLRRAALAAAASVMAQPIATSLRDTALEPAITGGGGLRFSVAGDEVLVGLFLAGVVWVAAWALEEGRSAQDELAKFV